MPCLIIFRYQIKKPPQGVRKGETFSILIPRKNSDNASTANATQTLSHQSRSKKTESPSTLKNDYIPSTKSKSIRILAPSDLKPGCEVKVKINGEEIKVIVVSSSPVVNCT